MRKGLLILLIASIKIIAIAQTVTDIYTVQQDTTLTGEKVSVTGIVTVSQGVFQPKITFIEDVKGGAFSGIAIYDDKAEYNLNVGDEVKVTGELIEDHGMTEIQIESCSIISSNNPLPSPELVKTSDLTTKSPTAESYESVLIRVNDVSVINDNLGYGEWLVDDGSGVCRVDDGAACLFYKVPETGTEISSITGIFKYNYGNFKIDPRYRSDIVEKENNIVLNIYNVHQDNLLVDKNVSLSGIVTSDSRTFKSGKIIMADVNGGPLSALVLNEDETSLSVNIGDKINVDGKVRKKNGSSEIVVDNYEIVSSDNSSPNAIIASTGNISTKEYKVDLYDGVLFRLYDVNVTDNSLGNGEIYVDDGSEECLICLNSVDFLPSVGTHFISITGILSFRDDDIKLQPRDRSDINESDFPPIGDTLKVIQRPILNVPAVVKTGEMLTVECTADPKTSSWKAELSRGQIQIQLQIKNAQYDPQNLLWKISALIPDVPVFGLYDLEISASNDIRDMACNAVNVISDFKDEYYFIHTTDPHLPTHKFYYETGSYSDSSEMVDLREVINDINIINPEFVLLTGDLINEGELEDFQYRRYYTRSKRLLTEFEVPFFLTSGNHDVGGWSSTPPPDGSARHLWWKFFGWKRLYEPPAGNPFYTQNYSFDYGSIHYIGLEAYKNYDRWRSDIYGKHSFTSGQLQWLKDDLAAASGSVAQVLFYHYDFKWELDLKALGVEMALWGHTHRDDGDIHGGYPYNISTKSVCDDNRAYRLVRVSDGTLQPSETISAGREGKNLRISFKPANDGTHTSLTAQIENSIDEQFEHAILRFYMPKNDGNVDVTGGELIQTDDSGSSAIYYISVNIQPLSGQTVKVRLKD